MQGCLSAIGALAVLIGIAMVVGFWPVVVVLVGLFLIGLAQEMSRY